MRGLMGRETVADKTVANKDAPEYEAPVLRVIGSVVQLTMGNQKGHKLDTVTFTGTSNG